MNSLQIASILNSSRTTRRYFIGCFASDKIPHGGENKFPHCMVINTDDSSGNGEHWIALYMPSPDRIEYYDSLGDWPPPYKNISEFLSNFKIVHYNNHMQLQSDRSSACGQHVIYFLHMRCKGVHFDKILHQLLGAKTRPDVIVANFVHKLVNYN